MLTHREAPGVARSSRNLAAGMLAAAISTAASSAARLPSSIQTIPEPARSARRSRTSMPSVGPHTIAFAITPADGQVKVISPNEALPAIANSAAIDGYTQPGSSQNTLAEGDNAVLLIELDGGPCRAGKWFAPQHQQLCRARPGD